jgi:hypothetical protein
MTLFAIALGAFALDNPAIPCGAAACETKNAGKKGMDINFSRWSLTTLFHFKSKVQRQPVHSHNISNPYHAVSVAPGNHSCPAAKKLQGMRFLSSEAPRLPLPTCGADKCTCRYQHHADRRSSQTRRRIGQSFNGSERRRSSGRRITDMDM